MAEKRKSNSGEDDTRRQNLGHAFERKIRTFEVPRPEQENAFQYPMHGRGQDHQKQAPRPVPLSELYRGYDDSIFFWDDPAPQAKGKAVGQAGLVQREPVEEENNHHIIDNSSSRQGKKQNIVEPGLIKAGTGQFQENRPVPVRHEKFVEFGDSRPFQAQNESTDIARLREIQLQYGKEGVRQFKIGQSFGLVSGFGNMIGSLLNQAPDHAPATLVDYDSFEREETFKQIQWLIHVTEGKHPAWVEGFMEAFPKGQVAGGIAQLVGMAFAFRKFSRNNKKLADLAAWRKFLNEEREKRTLIRGLRERSEGKAEKNIADEVVKEVQNVREETKVEGGVQNLARPLPPLRQAYIDEIRGLAGKAEKLRQAGLTIEKIARILHAERRAIGIRYKDITPPEKRREIYARNLKNYEDKLGPSIDWLRAHGKSWENIIESASRTGGKDLGF